VQRLRFELGVKFALVQSDVYQAFLDLAAEGNAEAGETIRPLRVIMPLYNEEIYFIVRSNSPLNFVHEIKDTKINVGPLRSGTAMSATTIYRQMFGAALPDANASFLSNEDALLKLVSDTSLDVVAVVAGSACQAAGRHEARGAQAHQAAEVRSRESGEHGSFQDLFPGDDPRVQLSQSPADRHTGCRSQGIPRHLRLQARRLGRAA
jgi:TRAP-type uncharacterized transport system substrate-binding protein